MNKKKILIASSTFYPRISPRSHRATELAKEFARQGYFVKVLTNAGGFNHSTFSKESGILVQDFVRGKYRRHTYSAKTVIGWMKKIYYGILKYLFMWPDIKLAPLLAEELKKESNYDLLISIAVPYPIHWGVSIAKCKNNELCKTWVADCGDPFTGSQEKSFAKPFYFYWIEKWFCKQPDHITVPIKNAIKAYPKACQKKIKVIPQGFNFKDLPIGAESVKNTNPIFAYTGAVSEIRNPKPFLNYLVSLKQNFCFIVYTKNKRYFETYKNRLGNKLIINDYVPRKQLLQELSKVDFLINLENKGSAQLPSKLIDYALIKKPIFSFYGDNFNPLEFLRFLKGDYSRSYRIEDLEKHNIQNVVNQFLMLCSK